MQKRDNMTKRKIDSYEECLREFIHYFHAANIKSKRKFAQALKSNDTSYAKGYAYGLNEAVSLLREITTEKGNSPDTLGFESTGLKQILSIVDSEE